ncbi:HAD-IB family hydrolase [Gordonia sp. GW1C4-4]|uniref:HAD-IB family hydrolase n=1 Tax=Gordonia tangerina TaxID=2911060 RepID=A0ABS9DEW2_9ACTN|nr:HAD-IB family hydrolase [Gordonia tangerina]
MDKTVIATSSVLAFTRPFFAAGLIDRRSVIRSGWAQLLFLMTAADHTQIDRLRRHVTDMCRGWDVAQVRAVVAETLHEVVHPLVFDEAAELIATHRARGDDVVLVSASGREMVEPIGAMLGVDHVAASEMEVVEGHYTGEIEVYLYGAAKTTAMIALAEQHDYDLSTCYAYSDSITDVPMLTAVGHPYVVNPDRHLRRHARDAGWPILTFSRPASRRSRQLPARLRTVLGSPLAAVALAVGAAVATARLAGFASRRHPGRPTDVV